MFPRWFGKREVGRVLTDGEVGRGVSSQLGQERRLGWSMPTWVLRESHLQLLLGDPSSKGEEWVGPQRGWKGPEEKLRHGGGHLSCYFLIVSSDWRAALLHQCFFWRLFSSKLKNCDTRGVTPWRPSFWCTTAAWRWRETHQPFVSKLQVTFDDLLKGCDVPTATENITLPEAHLRSRRWRSELVCWTWGLMTRVEGPHLQIDGYLPGLGSANKMNIFFPNSRSWSAWKYHIMPCLCLISSFSGESEEISFLSSIQSGWTAGGWFWRGKEGSVISSSCGFTLSLA